MRARYILILTLILVLSLQAIPGARSQDIPQIAYVVDNEEICACFGISNDSNVALVNASQAVGLNHAIMVIGERADTLELGGIHRYLAIRPFDSRFMINDSQDVIFGTRADEFDMVLVGGPGHNAYTRELLDRGILSYNETNITGTGLIIEAAVAPSGHTIVVVASAAGYPYATASPPVQPAQPDMRSPAGAIAFGIGLGLIGTYIIPFWGRSFEFMYGFITTYAGEVACEKETEIRNIHARQVKKVVIMGYSWRELIIATSCLVLFGIAFVIADGLELLPTNIIFYIVVGGFVIVAHDLGHRLVAYWLEVDAEFKFWGLGSVTMLLTSWLFGMVFAQPSRVIIEKEEHDAEEMAAVMLAGPAVSLGLSIIFLMMMPLGGPAESIGLLGFSMNMVTVVYSMMPFDPMDGKSIFAWNRTYWAILFVPVMMLFIVATYIVI